jgi:hypothetical protein
VAGHWLKLGGNRRARSSLRACGRVLGIRFQGGVGREEPGQVAPEYHQPLCAESCDCGCGGRREMFGVQEKRRDEVGLCIMGFRRAPEWFEVQPRGKAEMLVVY